MKFWNIFVVNPYKEDAIITQWRGFFSLHVDRITKILACIPDTYMCLLCGEFSNNFNSRASLKNHLKGGHFYRDVVNFWIQNFAIKSPDEIERLVNFDSNGNPKSIDGALLI